VKLVGADPPLRLTTHPAEDTSPAWSPDGPRIRIVWQWRALTSLTNLRVWFSVLSRLAKSEG